MCCNLLEIQSQVGLGVLMSAVCVTDVREESKDSISDYKKHKLPSLKLLRGAKNSQDVNVLRGEKK